jgi:hypothetical protein
MGKKKIRRKSEDGKKMQGCRRGKGKRKYIKKLNRND